MQKCSELSENDSGGNPGKRVTPRLFNKPSSFYIEGNDEDDNYWDNTY